MVTVNVGLAGSTQAILSPVNISNPPSLNSIVVDDSADSTARTVTVTSASASTGKISGLAPADITYEYFDTSDLTINGGSGGNTITVNETALAPFTTTLNSGTGGDAVNVQATGDSSSWSIKGQAGQDTVVIGSNAPATTGGTLAGIAGPVDVDNSLGFTDLTIDDSVDSTGHTATVTSSQLSGLAPVLITYAGSTDLSSLTVNGGAGSDAFMVTPWNNIFLAFALSINGDDPPPPASPGDTLQMVLTGLTNPMLTKSSTASGFQGTWTFGNAGDVDFTTMESLLPAATPTTITLTGGVVAGSTMITGTTTPEIGPNSCISVFACDGGICGETGALIGTAEVDSAGQFTVNLSPPLRTNERLFVVDACSSVTSQIDHALSLPPAAPTLSPAGLAVLVLLLSLVAWVGTRRYCA